MSFEIIDNIFQILVMFTAMCMAVVTAFRSSGRRLRLFYDGNFVLCFMPDHYRKSSTDLLCGRNFVGGSISFLFVSIVIKTETPQPESGDFYDHHNGSDGR